MAIHIISITVKLIGGAIKPTAVAIKLIGVIVNKLVIVAVAANKLVATGIVAGIVKVIQFIIVSKLVVAIEFISFMETIQCFAQIQHITSAVVAPFVLIVLVVTVILALLVVVKLIEIYVFATQ